MTHDDAKKKLILAGQVLVDAGQDDFTRGHISVRLPDDPGHFFMKPHSVGLDEITLANILTIDLAGNVVAGTARRHSEVYIHSEVYKARPDVHCVLHTHPPYAIALSASGSPLKSFSQPSALFHNSLGTYDDTINLIRTSGNGCQGGAGVRWRTRRPPQEPRRCGGRTEHRGGRNIGADAGERRTDSDDC